MEELVHEVSTENPSPPSQRNNKKENKEGKDQGKLTLRSGPGREEKRKQQRAFHRIKRTPLGELKTNIQEVV